jgi:hypothetical protein
MSAVVKNGERLRERALGSGEPELFFATCDIQLGRRVGDMRIHVHPTGHMPPRPLSPPCILTSGKEDTALVGLGTLLHNTLHDVGNGRARANADELGALACAGRSGWGWGGRTGRRKVRVASRKKSEVEVEQDVGSKQEV